MVEPNNEFPGSRSPTVPDDSDIQVPVKHELSDIFESDKFDGGFFGNGEWHNLVNCFCKLHYHRVLYFLIYYHLFYTYGKAKDQTHVDGSPNPLFI